MIEGAGTQRADHQLQVARLGILKTELLGSSRFRSCAAGTAEMCRYRKEEASLRLPEGESQPNGTGESPLAAIDEWGNSKCSLRRTGQERPAPCPVGRFLLVFLRYVDNHNDKELVSKEKAEKSFP